MHYNCALFINFDKKITMDRLFAASIKLVREVRTDFKRYMYDQINWKNRLIGLIGPRGVGKTTLVLQYINQNYNSSEALYVSAEDFYFADSRLTALADTFVKQGGKHLFIDEIHKYKDWARELKLIYDYHPELQIVFTGSSVLDIRKGASDLSRRAVMYYLHGLSFREYLWLFHDIAVKRYTLEEILTHKVDFDVLKHPLPYFNQYLRNGYYPFALEDDFEARLQQIINQTLEVDIPFYAGMNVATGRKLKQLLAIIAKSVPFKPNMKSISTALSVSRNSVADYCLYIEEAGLIAQLRPNTGGIKGLGKVEKIYLDNTNLVFSLGQQNANLGNIRETFFFNQLRVNFTVESSGLADFIVEGFTFEVGGKNKSQKQIKDIEKAFLVKDDLEAGFLNTCPLWQFGLLY
jgi:uncharacterized protein